MLILEKAGPYAGTHFQNDLYGSTSYQCLPDFTVGGADCPEGAQNMNDCTIDDYARHGNSLLSIFFAHDLIVIFLGGNCLKQHSSMFIYCSKYFDSSGLSEGNMIDSLYFDDTCTRNQSCK